MSTGLVFVALPRLAIEIVTQAAAAEPGVQVLGEFDDLETAVHALDATRVDAVVIACSDPHSHEVRDVLAAWPDARVVAISAGGGRAYLVELVVATSELSDTSAERVVAELRSHTK